MHLEHSFTLPVGIDEAWRVLHDIGSIAPALPGSTVTTGTPDSVEGTLKVKLGPLNATYKGSARLVSTDPDTRTAVVEATGDTARSGSASATVTATLREDGEATTVSLSTELEVTGKPAQFGQAVMSEVGSKLVGQFADRLGTQLTSGTWTPSDAADVPDAAAETVAVVPEGADVEQKPADEPVTAAADPVAELDPETIANESPAQDTGGDAADDVVPDTPADEPVAADQPTFAAPSAPVPPAQSGSGQSIPSVNGHGSPDPAATRTPSAATNRDLNAALRPFLVRGVAPVTLAALVVLGRLRRHRRKRWPRG